MHNFLQIKYITTLRALQAMLPIFAVTGDFLLQFGTDYAMI